MNSRFLTEDLKGICLPPMSALSLLTELRWETSVFSTFSLSLLLYIQPTRLSMQVWISQRKTETDREEYPLTTGYHRGRPELIGRSTFWQLGITSAFVIITLMATYQYRLRGLAVQTAMRRMFYASLDHVQEVSWPVISILLYPSLAVTKAALWAVSQTSLG